MGEDASSYGYGGTGKIAENSRFSNYGAPGFASGDVVASYLDMTSDPITISFSVNGAPMGVAFRIKSDRLQGRALFPHMLRYEKKRVEQARLILNAYMGIIAFDISVVSKSYITRAFLCASIPLPCDHSF